MKIINSKGQIDISATIYWYIKEVVKNIFNLVEPGTNETDLYEQGLRKGYKNGLEDRTVIHRTEYRGIDSGN